MSAGETKMCCWYEFSDCKRNTIILGLILCAVGITVTIVAVQVGYVRAEAKLIHTPCKITNKTLDYSNQEDTFAVEFTYSPDFPTDPYKPSDCYAIEEVGTYNHYENAKERYGRIIINSTIDCYYRNSSKYGLCDTLTLNHNSLLGGEIAGIVFTAFFLAISLMILFIGCVVPRNCQCD
jgi:hypothetical protein